MTLKEKIKRLQDAGYTISYASPGEELYDVVIREWVWHWYPKCPRHIGASDIFPDHRRGTRAFVDLSSVAAVTASDIDLHCNHVALSRDFPEGIFTDHSGCLGAYVGNLTEEVIDILYELRNCDLTYDEDMRLQMEDELIRDSIKDYVIDDLYRTWPLEMKDQWDVIPDGTRGKLFWYVVTDNDAYPWIEGMTPIWDYEKISGGIIKVVEEWKDLGDAVHGDGEEMLPLPEFHYSLAEKLAEDMKKGCEVCGHGPYDHKYTNAVMPEAVPADYPNWVMQDRPYVIYWCMKDRGE